MQTNTLIIGGGLSGLAIADRLHRKNSDFLLVEATDRFGGRIKSNIVNGSAYDLGPAWFWPGQPRIQSLVDRFNLNAFEQFSQGESVVEMADGRVLRSQGYASMEGSLRLTGGLSSLINALVKELPQDRIQLSCPVAALSHNIDSVTADIPTGSISANHAIIAAPPRIAGSTIAYSPALPQNAHNTLQNIPTWMAGHAKIVTIYDKPFWRQNGLSGDAVSQRGPLAEIHDASTPQGNGYALFGFVGVPFSNRIDQEQTLKQMAIDQMTRLFGKDAENPSAVLLEDWADNKWISAPSDQSGVSSHPLYGRPSILTGVWNGALSFSSTEMAHSFGGLMEGALEAAESF